VLHPVLTLSMILIAIPDAARLLRSTADGPAALAGILVGPLLSGQPHLRLSGAPVRLERLPGRRIAAPVLFIGAAMLLLRRVG
jgi:lipopolysaccharide export system permease protein